MFYDDSNNIINITGIYMSFSSTSSSSKVEPYVPMVSTFTLIERPIRWLHDSDNEKKKLGKAYDPSCLYGEPIHILMLKAVALPTITCLTPVTIVADIVVGVVEIAFASYKGCDKENLLRIAHIKFIASPIQQMTHITVSALSALAGASFIFIYWQGELPFVACLIGSGAFSSVPGYVFSQYTVGKILPQFLRPGGFNIFIDGGANDVHGNKYTEYSENFYQKYKSQYNQNQNKYNSNVKPWAIECQEQSEMLGLKEVKPTTGEELGGFDKFNNGIINKIEPLKLLGLNTNFTESELKKAYYKVALLLHPDKNAGRIEKATGLMKLLSDARSRLETELKAKS